MFKISFRAFALSRFRDLSPLRPDAQRGEQKGFERGGLIEIHAKEAGVVLKAFDGGGERTAGGGGGRAGWGGG